MKTASGVRRPAFVLALLLVFLALPRAASAQRLHDRFAPSHAGDMRDVAALSPDPNHVRDGLLIGGVAGGFAGTALTGIVCLMMRGGGLLECELVDVLVGGAVGAGIGGSLGLVIGTVVHIADALNDGEESP